MTPPRHRVQRPHQKHRRRERDVPQWVKARTTWEPSLEQARMLREANLSTWAPGELQEAWGK